MLKVNEIFGKNVIQGEGPYAGCPATFIRLFGCVAPFCDFCDTKYSWQDEQKECEEMTNEYILRKVKEFGNVMVVITGGEPYAQGEDLYQLMELLLNNGFNIQIETSGKCEIINRCCINDKIFIVISPKQYDGKFVVYNTETLHSGDYFKFVVENQEEMTNAIEFIVKHDLPRDKIYIMPKGATREEQIKNSPFVIEQCSKYGFIYGPRLHVLLFDSKRGV